MSLRPSPSVAVKSATLLPVIARSASELRDWRVRFEDEVDRLLSSDIALEDPLIQIGRANFFLAYHGLNDRPIQTKMAQFIFGHARAYSGPRRTVAFTQGCRVATDGFGSASSRGSYGNTRSESSIVGSSSTSHETAFESRCSTLVSTMS